MLSRRLLGSVTGLATDRYALGGDNCELEVARGPQIWCSCDHCVGYYAAVCPPTAYLCFIDKVTIEIRVRRRPLLRVDTTSAYPTTAVGLLLAAC